MRRDRLLAAAADLASIVVFILVGGGQHHVSEDTAWFLNVLWPLAAGWFAAAIVLGLYRVMLVRPASRWALRLAGTIVLGVLVGALLRGTFTDRPTFSTFTIVYLTWMTLTTFGWRGGWMLVRARRRRRNDPATPVTS
jgi:hypothetical protein